MNTVIGLFDDRTEAQLAERELLQAGFRKEDFETADSPPATGSTDSGGFWNRVKDWFGLEDQNIYAEAARRGSKLVTVKAADDRKTELAEEILERHHPIDIDRRIEDWKRSGWKASKSGNGHGQQSIPVVEEQLKVGKRRVGKGGVRVYSHITERPVDETIELREEKAHVERRRVDRPAREDAFRERTVEITESREEPVVSKEARVVEEVVVGKDVKERTEHVRDKLRRTEVEVEHLDDDEMRQDYERNFASKGMSFEDYKPACAYGRELASKNRNQQWPAIESQAQRDYEQRRPGTWNRMRDVVRHGFDRARIDNR
jgi:uncharacterized protein (TIGR02271 family)